MLFWLRRSVDGLAGAGRRAYDRAVIGKLRVAVEALNRGDVEPFVALVDESSEWRGVASGHMWWKEQPS